MEATMEWQWVGVAAGLVLAYGVARNLPDIRRYLRMRRM
ncbi:DUF6893 family small protein [Streptomyces aureus]|jgi:hypothetical protein